jgi:hypothetical protein
MQILVLSSDEESLELGERFAFYAKRIRTLSFKKFFKQNHWPSTREMQVIHPDVYLLWAQVDYLFTRFCGLIISSDFLSIPRSTTALNRFLTLRALTSLEIYRGISNDLTALLECRTNIMEICHRLQSLTVVPSATGLTNLVNDMLQHTACLRILRTHLPIRFEHILRLSSSSELRELRLQRVVQVPQNPKLLSRAAFRSLRSLRLRDSTLSAELSKCLLDFTSNHYFTTCSLQLEAADLSLDDLFLVIQHLTKHTTLKRVHILACSEKDFTSSIIRSATLISTFHSLHKLEVLIFFTNGEFQLNHDIVTNLISACPRLRTWIMRTKQSHENLWSATSCPMPFLSFLHLLRHNPSLQELPVSVYDLTTISAEPMASFGAHSYGPLLLIEKGEEDTAGFQDLVRSLFPQVSTVLIRGGTRRNLLTIPLENQT